MKEYYIRFKHIPVDMMLTPQYYIPTDHIQVKAKQGANEWDLQNAICNELKNLQWLPEHIRIESYQVIN